MLQTLLADRFRLTLRRETRDLPVYDLTAKKSGLKLPPPKNTRCVSFPPGTTPQYVPGAFDCGYAPLLLSSSGLRMEGRKLHMADLVRELARALGEPVLDKTGFTGEFDIDLNYTDEDIMKSPGFAAPDDAGGNRLPDWPQPLNRLRRNGPTRAEAPACQGPRRSARSRSRGETHPKLNSTATAGRQTLLAPALSFVPRGELRKRERPSLPPYPVKDCSQASSLLRMDTFNEAYPALQMFPEMRVTFAVLSA